MQITEIGRQRVTELSFAKQLGMLSRRIKNKDELLDAMFVYVAMMLCADENGCLSATDEEQMNFINSNLDEIKQVIMSAKSRFEHIH
jgi:hypothetical protein